MHTTVFFFFVISVSLKKVKSVFVNTVTKLKFYTPVHVYEYLHIKLEFAFIEKHFENSYARIITLSTNKYCLFLMFSFGFFVAKRPKFMDLLLPVAHT